MHVSIVTETVTKKNRDLKDIVKIDYKNSNVKPFAILKLPLCMRHVGLGCFALLCLTLAFSNTSQKISTLAPVQEPIALPIATATPDIPKEIHSTIIATTPDVPKEGNTTTATAPITATDSPKIIDNTNQPVNTPHKAQIIEKIEKQKKLPEKKLAFTAGAIRNSLASSGKKAGLDTKVINQMVEIFGGKIDFSTDLRPNDSFRVLYEEKVVNGVKVETGHILAVELINQGETYQAVRYIDKTGHAAYFSPEGNGLNEAFLRSPVDFVSISSGFGPRQHPICHRIKQHRGVDYRAPTGTPVKATANAKVVFSGKKGGYGNAIELQHGARYSTFYAHLSRFAKNIKPGTEVKQGQVIGYVGQTGHATGAHLHYEFRIDGVHRNPLTAVMPKQNSIAPAHRHQFIAHAKAMIKLLNEHQNLKNNKTKMASNYYQQYITR